MCSLLQCLESLEFTLFFSLTISHVGPEPMLRPYLREINRGSFEAHLRMMQGRRDSLLHHQQSLFVVRTKRLAAAAGE